MTDAPRRREVRRAPLQGVGRPPRRGRVRRERAVRVARGGDPPGRKRLHAALRPGEAPERSPGRGEDVQARHDDPVQAGPRDLRDHDFSFDVLANRLRELAFLNKGVKIQIEDERRREEGRRSSTRAASGSSSSTSTRTRPRCTPRCCTSRAERDGIAGRGRRPVQRRLRRERLLLREQHQHARGRHAPHGLQGGPHAHDQRLRAGERAPEEGQGHAHAATTSARG